MCACIALVASITGWCTKGAGAVGCARNRAIACGRTRFCARRTRRGCALLCMARHGWLVVTHGPPSLGWSLATLIRCSLSLLLSYSLSLSLSSPLFGWVGGMLRDNKQSGNIRCSEHV
ncbi:hypothetical protein EDD21DRAFT_393314 [Dissophora ornata]|nr:hypothetical protein EDD21DRAFT_393314 [Dissophora ornata]